ncbi:hypothetical protein SKAU_G00253140 [Synaphobranchus kaupii]|uniref:Lethal giant larvae homologue 2 domain-containing protein n=1 Tax=Synaphobranchus kaupii TaxID=118154 RepID=A0A9Q1F386_SYNKA|nr:hypothetical protein SKAU_G00253140 [Synaphobranchus kaupii]
MDHPIVDFLVLCETPYPNEVQEPYAVAVLLEKDFIVVDLSQSNFPIFENPYPMDIHESPVTCTDYFADCPPDLIPVLYSIGAKHKKHGYSQKEWPVGGGTWTLGTQTYPEIIITGHADGSIKFWDATAITLQMLYKLKSSKVFEKLKTGEGRGAELVEEDPYAVQMVRWCPQSRLFCVVGISAHVILYRFSRHDATTEITCLEVRLQCEVEDVLSPSETEANPTPSDPNPPSPLHLPASPNSTSPEVLRDSVPCLRVKSRPVRMPPGYQAELVVQLLWVDGEPPQQITSLDLNSAYGLLALGNCNGLAVVDYLQKTILLCVSTLELYGSSDPYQRLARSPRRNRQLTADSICMRGLSNFYSDSKKRIRTSYQSLTELSDSQVPLETERSRSPTSDHVNGHCTSPTSQSCAAGKPRAPPIPEGPRLGGRRGPSRPPFRKAQSAACMEISLPVSHTEESRENSFSRSRSSSVSSIDRETKEAVTTLRFMESYAHKTDAAPAPCLWERLEEPVTVTPSGMVLMLKGSVLTFGSLDCGGALIPEPYEVWRDPHAPEDPDRPRKRKLVTASPGSSQDVAGEGHLAVVCSDRQAKVFLMPAQTCLVCLACFCANGHVMMLSLPSLRPLLDVNYLPLTDMRIARTFCFTNGGQALYLSSATEMQRISYSQEMCDSLQEMLGELFVPVETPEVQNRGFLKGFFGGNAQTFDREELFGEATAGKASRSLAQHIPGQGGMEGMKAAAGGVVGGPGPRPDRSGREGPETGRAGGAHCPHDVRRGGVLQTRPRADAEMQG